VLVFPLIPLGTDGANYIGGKQIFPGSYTIRSSTLRAVFMDLATVLGEQRFRWIFVVHHHGAPNHHRALDQAGDYFHDLFGGQMINLSGLAMASLRDAESKSLTEKERDEDGFSIHAGLSETSRILFLRPDLVSLAFRDAPPHAGENMDELIRIAEKKDWPGYFGSPRLASVAFGARVWDQFSATVVSLALKILDGFDHRQVPRHGDVAKAVPANQAIDKAALEHDQKIERKQRDWLRKNEYE
jgi:creatinine amidohydrolase/Fe(II)-dependent formamide hydrolase-like protein